MSDFKGRIADLSPQQLEALRRKLQKKKSSPGGGKAPAAGLKAAIPRRIGDGPWPLSYAQLSLWLIDQLGAPSAAYHIPVQVDLKGALDLPRLEAALAAVVARHEVLRTAYRLDTSGEGGSLQPQQHVLPAPPSTTSPAARSPWTLPVVDLTSLPSTTQASIAKAMAELTAAEARRAFDLESGVVVRGVVMRAAVAGPQAQHRLLLTLHHIAADNWSVTLLMQEIMAHYNGSAAPTSLLPLPVQYADYTLWQRRWLEEGALEEQLRYWRRQLEGAPPRLELPTDRRRPERPSFRFGRLPFRVPKGLTDGLRSLAQEEGATLTMVLLAAFYALLARYTERADLVVGTPVANRRRPELEGLIGFFVNMLVLRCGVRPGEPFTQLLASAREALLGAHAHQDLPFERLVEALQPERDTSYQPLFQVLFNVYDGALPPFTLEGLEVADLEVSIGTFHDLDLLLVAGSEGLEGYLRYNLDLFDEATVEGLATAYKGILGALLVDPRQAVAKLPLPDSLALQAAAARERDRPLRLALSATFTADPLVPMLEFWLEQLGLLAEVAVAPYNQVFQELLDPASLLAANDGINLLFLRFEDWVRYSPEAGDDGKAHAGDTAQRLEAATADLLRALPGALERSTAPFLLLLGPPSPEFREIHDRLATTLRRGIADLAGVYLTTDGELAELYPVAEPFDPHRDALGHIPYRDPLFAAAATLFARRIHGLVHPPAKVLALDCDQTLWRGVVGEDGPEGVVLESGHRWLQEWAVACQQQGVLLCLVSKNEEADVFAALDQRSDMPLKREYLAAHRIGWEAKSAGIAALAQELSLGLDSFVFVDDNPVECAEVRAALPAVTVVPLAQDPADIPDQLRHLWPLDRLRVTAEDRKRTELYRQNAERRRLEVETTSFGDFLESLALEVVVAPPTAEEMPRVAQLTQRTNQFNASTVRREEGELGRLLAAGELEARAVRVKDRFGDYGLVGLALFRSQGGELVVDTLLLSCRVLGKGVEHRLLATLGGEARARGLKEVAVPFRPTERNRPVRLFLDSVTASLDDVMAGGVVAGGATAAGVMVPPEAAEHTFRWPATALAELSFEPQAATAAPSASVALDETAALASGLAPERLAEILGPLRDPETVVARVTQRGLRRRGGEAGLYVAPRTPLEERIAGIFAAVLGLDQVGVQDSFFRLGGHSLSATAAVARLREELGLDWSLQALFEDPTVEALAQRARWEWVEAAAARDAAALERELAQLTGLSDGKVQERLWEEFPAAAG
ncbi:MAG: HAD-IIIC family phosphatase [Acidobacteriota bacterium]